jgi:hypothetical protein
MILCYDTFVSAQMLPRSIELLGTQSAEDRAALTNYG